MSQNVTEVPGVGFAVEPITDCPHVAAYLPISGDVIGSAADKFAAPCCEEDCESSENWLCLSCNDVYCSRYVNEHMAAHYEMTKADDTSAGVPTGHCVAVSFSDLSVWCYECLSGDGAYIKDPGCRPLLEALHVAKFGEATGAGAGTSDATAEPEARTAWSRDPIGAAFSEGSSEEASHIFVYGTLRPDATHTAGYTTDWLRGMTHQKAVLPHGKLYFDSYPVVKLDPPVVPDAGTEAAATALATVSEEGAGEPAADASEAETKADDAGASASAESEGPGVVGYVVSCATPEAFAEKLSAGDEIEGWPTYYQRATRFVKVEGSDDPVLAYVYFRATPSTSTPIASGDFLEYASHS